MKTFEEYSGEGVVFVSMTKEGEDELEKIDGWAQSLQIPWSIGYGASKTLEAFEIPGYPTTFVIGRDGKVAWHSFRSGSLDRAIQDALR